MVGTTVRVCGGTTDVVIGGGGAGARLVVSEEDGGADADVVGVLVVDVFAPPPRDTYTPSTIAAMARTPMADARIGTARDFRWGGAGVGSLLRSCVGVLGSAALRLGGVAAARVGADAG